MRDDIVGRARWQGRCACGPTLCAVGGSAQPFAGDRSRPGAKVPLATARDAIARAAAVLRSEVRARAGAGGRAGLAAAVERRAGTGRRAGAVDGAGRGRGAIERHVIAGATARALDPACELARAVHRAAARRTGRAANDARVRDASSGADRRAGPGEDGVSGALVARVGARVVTAATAINAIKAAICTPATSAVTGATRVATVVGTAVIAFHRAALCAPRAVGRRARRVRPVRIRRGGRVARAAELRRSGRGARRTPEPHRGERYARHGTG